MMDGRTRQAVGLKSVRRNIALARQLTLFLQRACPACPEQLASSIAVDLADIWSIGERHRRSIRDLLRLRFPVNEDKLYSILASRIEVDLLGENVYHLESLKRCLPEFWKKLETGSRRTKKSHQGMQSRNGRPRGKKVTP
jgi:hypothetical protein